MDVPKADEPEEPPETPALRALRRLVTLLMAVLIVGMVAVTAALVIGLGRLGGGAGAIDAAALALPEGHAVTALGRGEGTVLVLTEGPDGAETLRAFEAATGRALSATPIRRTPER